MKVTPLDIRRKEFKRSVRGYSDEEVDLFLDEVADEFERLFQENVALQEKLKRLEEQAGGNTQLRDALEKTLVSAQLHADETRANARKESESILREAELKAQDIVADSHAETQRMQQALVRLSQLEEDFRSKFRSLLEGHLKLLEESSVEVASDQPAAEVAPTEMEMTPFVVPEAVEDVPEYAPAPVAGARAVPAPVSEAPATSPEGAPAAMVPAAAVESGEPDAGVGGWEAEGRDLDSVTAETVEMGSAFEAFDKAEAGRETADEGSTTGATEEDTLAGFFASGKLDDVGDVFLDPDKGGKDKARDFEW